MDLVTNFDDIPMSSVTEEDDDSLMDVNPHAASPSHQTSFGEWTQQLWSTPPPQSGSSVHLLFCE
jgi:hypothetical protein